MGEYDANFGRMIFAFDRPDEAPTHCGALRDGSVIVRSRTPIEVPPEDSILFYTGLKLKPALYDHVQINPEELTYHFMKYPAQTGFTVELYQKDPVEDVIGNRIIVDRDIILKIYNEGESPLIIEEDEVLGMIYAVKKIFMTWNSHHCKRKYTIGSSSQQTTKSYTIHS
jgi:hypothetical protein